MVALGNKLRGQNTTPARLLLKSNNREGTRRPTSRQRDDTSGTRTPLPLSGASLSDRCPSRSGPGRLPFPHGHARAAASNRPARASAPAAARSRRCPTPAGRRREGRAIRSPPALRARVLARPHPSTPRKVGRSSQRAPRRFPSPVLPSHLPSPVNCRRRRGSNPRPRRLSSPLVLGARRHLPAAAPSARGSPLSARRSRGGEGGAGGGRRWERGGGGERGLSPAGRRRRALPTPRSRLAPPRSSGGELRTAVF